MRHLILAGLLALGASQEGMDASILTTDRVEIRATLVGYEASGVFRVRSGRGARDREIAVEEVVKIVFAPDENPAPDARADQLRLFHGGLLSGRLLRYENSIAEFEGLPGTHRLARSQLRSISFGAPAGPMPEIKGDIPGDILVHEVEVPAKGTEKAARKLEALYGELTGVGEKISFTERAGGKVTPRELERAAVKQVLLQHNTPSAEVTPGRYAKFLLRNGDRFVGVLRGFAPRRILYFSHLFGDAEIEVRHVLSISFVPSGRLGSGHILVSDQGGLHEFNRQGKGVWRYQQNTQYAWALQKLENGNVLVANTNYNQVIEIRPGGPGGGEIVWRLDGVNYPYDARRLENGNTLVAENNQSRVVEYDHRSKAPVWTCLTVQRPTCAQRLDNGNTLICGSDQVVEVGRDGKERWRPRLTRIRAWRAERLENGNTLLVDYHRGQVIEIDPQSVEVWRKEGLSQPTNAIRLEDGNTLIVENNQNRVIEVDPGRRTIRTITENLAGPQGLAVY